MFWRSAIALFSGLAAIWPAIANAREVRLPASSKWVMDYAADSCQLGRTFGTGDDTTFVQLIRYEPSTNFDLNLIGRPLGVQTNRPAVRLRFGMSGEFVRSNAMAGSSGKDPALFLTGRLDNFDRSKFNVDDLSKWTATELDRLEVVNPATEAAVESMTLMVRGRVLVFELGSMAAPMAAMRKCLTALVTDWGLNVSEQAALVSRPLPKGNPGDWLKTTDYPSDSWMRGEQAIIRFRLMIDASGAVTACSVQTSIAKGDFAQLTCDLLKRRARFEPARNVRNEAVASYFVGKALWVMSAN